MLSYDDRHVSYTLHTFPLRSRTTKTHMCLRTAQRIDTIKFDYRQPNVINTYTIHFIDEY